MAGALRRLAEQVAMAILMLLAVLCLAGCSSASIDESARSGPEWYRPLSEKRTYTATVPHDEDEAARLVERGWRLGQKGDHETAITELTRAIELLTAPGKADGPRAAEAYLRRGIVYWTAGDSESAVADYTLALAYEPESWEPYFHRWQAYLGLGEIEKAAADRARGMTLDRDVFKRDYSSLGGLI